MRERTDLFDLLPIVYRRRDKEAGHQLRALMSVANEQYDLLLEDIAGLYDHWFVETCDEWLLPYLGELVGFEVLPAMHESMPAARSLIANNLDYERQKGMAETIERVTTAATGWPCHVTEAFTLLARTQAISAVNMRRGRNVSFKDEDALLAMDTPFTTTARSIDIRQPSWDLATGGIGKPASGYDIGNLQLFLWRIRAFRSVMREAKRVRTVGSAIHYTFDPFGRDVHLMNDPLRGTSRRNDAEYLLPVPLRRRAMANDLATRRTTGVTQSRYFGNAPAFSVYSRSTDPGTNGTTPNPVRVEADRIRICDLSTWTIPSTIVNESRVVAVDPELGRFAMIGWPDALQPLVDYAYGLAGDVGGGPYNRSGEAAPVDRRTWFVKVGRAFVPDATTPRTVFETLADALAVWGDSSPTTVIQISDGLSTTTSPTPDGCEFFVLDIDGARRIVQFPRNRAGNSTLLSQLIEYWTSLKQRGVVRFVDSGTYWLTQGAAGGTLRLKCQTDLVLEADDGCCPVLLGPLRFESGKLGSRLTLSGLWLKGPIELNGPLTLNVRHSTIIVPDAGAKDAAIVGTSDDQFGLRVHIEHSIVGGVQLSTPSQGLQIVDSIVHAEKGVAIGRTQTDEPGESGCTASVVRSTVVGAVIVNALTALDSIFHDAVTVTRRDVGELRHSFVPQDSIIPQRIMCRPDVSPSIPLLLERPTFKSLRSGHPGYMQLDLGSPETILKGASNGSEMGVFNRLQQPQVLALLRRHLPSFVPFDMYVGVSAIT